MGLGKHCKWSLKVGVHRIGFLQGMALRSLRGQEAHLKIFAILMSLGALKASEEREIKRLARDGLRSSLLRGTQVQHSQWKISSFLSFVLLDPTSFLPPLPSTFNLIMDSAAAP